MQKLSEMNETERNAFWDQTAGTPLIMRLGDKTVVLESCLSEFPPEAILAFIRYGFQRKFNDHIGSAKLYPTKEDKLEAAALMMADWQAGKFNLRGAGATPIQEAMRIVIRKVYGPKTKQEHKDCANVTARNILADRVLSELSDDDSVMVTVQAEAWIEAREAEQTRQANAVREIKIDLA